MATGSKKSNHYLTQSLTCFMTSTKNVFLTTYRKRKNPCEEGEGKAGCLSYSDDRKGHPLEAQPECTQASSQRLVHGQGLRLRGGIRSHHCIRSSVLTLWSINHQITLLNVWQLCSLCGPWVTLTRRGSSLVRWSSAPLWSDGRSNSNPFTKGRWKRS